MVSDPARVRSFCGKSSWVAGVTEMCDGALVYRDYVYDDDGADSGSTTMPIPALALVPSAGDAKYPTGAENTADLVRFEMRLDGPDVVVTYELNTLYRADQTIAAIAIDTDDNAATGGGMLPGLGVSAPGWDFFKTFTNGDPATNVISGRFPKPPGEVWRIYALVAQADGTVMNVAFRGTDESARASLSSKDPSSLLVLPSVGDFWEDKQAAALMAKDISPFYAKVCASDMRTGLTRGAEIKPGLHERVYTSKYTLDAATGKPVPPGSLPGEGVSLAGIPGRHGASSTPCEQSFNYLGKYQPYGFYLPDQPGPHRFQLLLHACDFNHASVINEPGYQADMAENLNLVVASPLGRGGFGFYSDISERDVLDVYDDVLANEEVDPDSAIISGYSMGGYGALRLGALYPDRWAAATNWVGFTGREGNFPAGPGGVLFPVVSVLSGAVQNDSIGSVGNVIDFVQNLRHIPTLSMYGAADELVHAQTSLAMQETFGNNDVEQAFYMHANAEHLSFMILDSWQREAAFAANRKRVKNPSHVTYRTDASLDYPEYAIKHDRAYWLSSIKAAGAGYSDLDATTFGCGTPEDVLTLSNTAGAGPLPLAWTLQAKTVTGATPIAQANRVEIKLANVAEVTVDTASACLDRSPISYHVETTTPATLHFSDGRSVAFAVAGIFDGTK